MSVRKLTRRVIIGDVPVGGGAPVSVQSMTNTPTEDAAATLEQIRRMADAGCRIARVAVPNLKKDHLLQRTLRALAEIVDGSPLPLVADIHFDHTLALVALEAGVQGLRINPGNIGSEEKVREVADAAKKRGVPIRVGVNAGSLRRDILERHGHLDVVDPQDGRTCPVDRGRPARVPALGDYENPRAFGPQAEPPPTGSVDLRS